MNRICAITQFQGMGKNGNGKKNQFFPERFVGRRKVGNNSEMA